MNIINVENITKSYTGRKLFSKASFYVQENEKIGIIGINGTGKSTLLKIVAGDEEPDEGTVTTANHIVINYLPQNPEFDPDETALEHVMSRVVTSQLDEDMRWSIESDAKSLLMKLDITDMAQKTGELSGGQRKRLALATVVLKPCDVLILDEPTNHLDYEMVEWLEDYLRRFRATESWRWTRDRPTSMIQTTRAFLSLRQPERRVRGQVSASASPSLEKK